MRRKSTGPKTPSDPFDLINDFGPERLQTFGAVVIGWNIIETYVDYALGVALKVHVKVIPHVTSRINGMDGKLAIIKECLSASGIDEQSRLPLSKTLNAVESFKRMRDGIVHVKIVDPKADVADTIQRKGVSDEVLISQEALDALLERFALLHVECKHLFFIFYHAAIGDLAKSDEETEQAVKRCRESLTQLQDHQRQREALGPLPKFPDEVQVPEDLASAQALPG